MTRVENTWRVRPHCSGTERVGRVRPGETGQGGKHQRGHVTVPINRREVQGSTGGDSSSEPIDNNYIIAAPTNTTQTQQY